MKNNEVSLNVHKKQVAKITILITFSKVCFFVKKNIKTLKVHFHVSVSATIPAYSYLLICQKFFCNLVLHSAKIIMLIEILSFNLWPIKTLNYYHRFLQNSYQIVHLQEQKIKIQIYFIILLLSLFSARFVIFLLFNITEFQALIYVDYFYLILLDKNFHLTGFAFTGISVMYYYLFYCKFSPQLNNLFYHGIFGNETAIFIYPRCGKVNVQALIRRNAVFVLKAFQISLLLFRKF